MTRECLSMLLIFVKEYLSTLCSFWSESLHPKQTPKPIVVCNKPLTNPKETLNKFLNLKQTINKP